MVVVTRSQRAVPTQGVLNAACAGVNVSAVRTLPPSKDTGVLEGLIIEPSVTNGSSSVSGGVTLLGAVSTDTVVALGEAPVGRIKPGSTISVPEASVQHLSRCRGREIGTNQYRASGISFSASDRP